MFASFLEETFRRISVFAVPLHAKPTLVADGELLQQAVEHVVDETYGRLRLLSGYNERLREPVRQSLLYIDKMVETLPEAIHCCRSAYVSDPRVNAFFVGPQQMCEIFSRNEDVRRLFDTDSSAQECWALLCMHKDERHQFGMALLGDDVRREVMQTGVSFTDHQVVSPCASETDARRGLKCCIFNSLLAYIRRRATTAKETRVDLENRRKVLLKRLQQDLEESKSVDLRDQIARIENDLAAEELCLVGPEDHLRFVSGVLETPSLYVSYGGEELHLNRMGVKLEADAGDAGYRLSLSEIRVSCHEPRIATLVRFPRSELLPQQDYLEKADLFLNA